IADVELVAAARRTSKHPNVELVLAEWAQSLNGSTLDPATMDVALHHATVLALGPPAGLSRAHHAIFWEFIAPGLPNLGIVAHDFTPKPAYWAFALSAPLVTAGSSLHATAAAPDVTPVG